MTFFYMVFYEIKNRFYHLPALAVSVLIPLVLVVALWPISRAVMEETSRTTRFSVAIVDEEQSFYTKLFMGKVLASPSIKNNLDVVLTDQRRAEILIEQNEIAGIIVIPAFFTQSMMTGEFKPIELYLNQNKPLQSQLILEGMKSGGYLMSAVQNSLYTVYQYLSILPSDSIDEVQLENLFNTEMVSFITKVLERNDMYNRETKTPWENMSLTSFYCISILLLFTAMYSSMAIVGYRENENNMLYRRVGLLGISPFQVACADMTASVTLLFCQGACIMIPMLFMQGVGLKGLVMLPFLLLICIQMVTIAVVVAVFIKKTLQASVIVIGLNLFLSLASGSLIPMYFMPAFIPDNLRLFSPHYWWQQTLIYAYSLGENVRANIFWYGVPVIIVSTGLLFLLLRGLLYEKDN